MSLEIKIKSYDFSKNVIVFVNYKLVQPGKQPFSDQKNVLCPSQIHMNKLMLA